jgi:hypothetical protein
MRRRFLPVQDQGLSAVASGVPADSEFHGWRGDDSPRDGSRRCAEPYGREIQAPVQAGFTGRVEVEVEDGPDGADDRAEWPMGGSRTDHTLDPPMGGGSKVGYDIREPAEGDDVSTVMRTQQLGATPQSCVHSARWRWARGRGRTVAADCTGR